MSNRARSGTWITSVFYTVRKPTTSGRHSVQKPRTTINAQLAGGQEVCGRRAVGGRRHPAMAFASLGSMDLALPSPSVPAASRGSLEAPRPSPGGREASARHHTGG